MTTTNTFKDIVASAVISGYKWLTQTLYTIQQAFALRPYFTAHIIDDTIQPNAQLFSGAGTPLGNGSMAVAPDGKVFAVGLDGSNNLCLFSAPDLNAAAGVFPSSVILDTTGEDFLDAKNVYSIAISDAYKGLYRITIWYFANFTNDGSNLTIKLQFSDNGGATFTKRSFSPSSLPNDSIGNLSLASFKPVLRNGTDGFNMHMGCFYIKPNGNFNSTGYDIYYIYGINPGGSYTTDALWYQNANSYDWTIHSLSAFYLNGIQYCVFSGYRNILDSIGINNNYSIWVTALLNNTVRLSGDSTKDLWMQPVAIIPVGSASNTNKNSFTYPSASVANGMVYITFNATVVDSVRQTSQGSSAVVVTTHTNYMMVQSDDGVGYSYPSVLVGTTGVEFNNGTYASFVLQNNYWYLGGAAGYLWQYIQNNIVADVSSDVIGYDIQEAAGQPSSISLKIANADNKWVGSSPTGAGAAAIARNKKIALWQGYYNANSVPELVPHSVYYIDDIHQQVSSTKNDVTLVGRDFYKKLKTTITKFSYQFIGPTFFTDIFDGSFISNWNQIAGTWKFFVGGNPQIELDVASGGDDKIVLVGSNQNSYGHLMRVFMRDSNLGTGHIYALYIDADNWLRLELNCADGESWAVVQNVAGTPTTLDSGTMPFVMSDGNYYGIYIRRYDYFNFTFMISGVGSAGGDDVGNYNPASMSYVFKNAGTGEYDLSAIFSGNASWQVPFTVGFGRASSGPIDWRWFMFSTFNDSNDLGYIIRRIARIAGIFAFKISYTWRELLFIPNLAGTYTINNRKITVTAGNKAISNTNTFSNGEISFRAKMSATVAANAAGFKFVFRGDSNDPANAYYFHVLREATAFNQKSTFCRFERLIASAGPVTVQFYNSGYDVSNNPVKVGSLNVDITQWHTYRIKMIDGWFYAFIDDVMVASWNDNNCGQLSYLTTGNWGFEADTNTTIQVKEINAPNLWKPVQIFSFNPGDDAESSIESLLASLRAWVFSDLLGRFKAIFLGSTNPSTYVYNTQLFQQEVDDSDKEYVSQVTVYGNGVAATSRNTNLMSGVPTRDVVLVDYTITTQQDAQTRADNELINRNQYRNQYSPRQFINVGAELFDAVTITNTGNNTTGVDAVTRVYSEEFSQGGGNNNSDYSIQLDTGNL